MNQRSTPDAGTELESLDAIREKFGVAGSASLAGDGAKGATPRTAAEPVRAVVDEQPYRPTIRPAIPCLTILDDGEQSTGEMVRLRVPVTVIGRSEGDVLIPHDTLISKRHAEVVREGKGAQVQWLLRDLDSVNHTFVSCVSSILQPKRLIVLGSRRFRFQCPESPASMSDVGDTTGRVDVPRDPHALWPALVLTNATDGEGVIPLTGVMLTVGRPGFGNDIELDDPCVAARHAEIARLPSGQWQIKALPSRNGVWVQIKTVRLTSLCRFQCGEQRFLFSA